MIPRGVLTALITPLDERGELSERALRWLVEEGIRGGVHGVVFGGTTGEGAFLPQRVRYRGLVTVAEAVRGRIAVLAGIEECRWEEAVDGVRQAKDLGADAVVVAPPYYEKLDPQEIERFYVNLVETCDFPVVLYHIPSRTHNPIAPEVVARLAKDPRVVGIKDSGGDLEYFRSVRQAVQSSDFRCWIGFAGPLDQCLAAKGDGTICAVANILPKEVRGLWDVAVFTPDRIDGYENRELIAELETMARQGGGVRLWKAAVGWILAVELSMAPPLLPLSKGERGRVQALLARRSEVKQLDQAAW